MARLDLRTEYLSAKYLEELYKGVKSGSVQPRPFKEVQEFLQKETKQYVERSQLRRIAKQVKVDFDAVVAAPAGKPSLMAAAHNNLAALTRRVELLEGEMEKLKEWTDFKAR